MPGGRREVGESPEDTLRRELWEEACAELVDFELIGYQRFRYVQDDVIGPAKSDAMYWARARCHEFVARFETKVRALRPLEEVRADRLYQQPLTQRLLDRAEAAERRH